MSKEQLVIDLIETDTEYQFTLGAEPVIKIDKDSVKDKATAQDICEALIFALNAGIEIGKQLGK